MGEMCIRIGCPMNKNGVCNSKEPATKCSKRMR
jgi:hypothetical protein